MEEYLQYMKTLRYQMNAFLLSLQSPRPRSPPVCKTRKFSHLQRALSPVSKNSSKMEEYLQYMKTLRYQMNDVEDQAAKISVEEQMQITTIQTLEKDLDLAKSDTRRFKEDTDQMVKAKGRICSQILEKQRKIASLESDSSTLTQTLELIQQERVNLSTRLVEKSAYYTKVADEINNKLEEQQEWINSYKISSTVRQHGLIKDKIDEQAGETEGKCMVESCFTTDRLDDEVKNLKAKMDSAKAKLDWVTQMKFKLVSDNSKVKKSVELAKCRINDFKPELKAMDIKTLEEEHRALLSDKAGETEFLQSLQHQSDKLKGISHVVKCACGEEYKVEVGLCV
ncbi:hypothetical protein F0562_035076 [Nyssa sinensis]|uniref:Uncharacterized protein n=1 Tax=Nyssa sinensis TaxID=561372 RepID=A0A5J5AAM2_9ASTE|nr:hypothetical protein F0562_035076 [Nyssa sinensis]